LRDGYRAADASEAQLTDAFTEIPERELRVIPPPFLLKVHKLPSCIHRNPTKGIERLGPSLVLYGLDLSFSVAFTEIPQRELRGICEGSPLRVCVEARCIQRNPTKGIERLYALLALLQPEARCIQRNPTKGIESRQSLCLMYPQPSYSFSVVFKEIPQRELIVKPAIVRVA
jgi:hypothetical protein